MKNFVKKAYNKISKLSKEQVERLIEVLSNENDTLDAILESLSTGLVIVDEKWNILYVNKAAERCIPFRERHIEHSSDFIPVWDLIDDEAVVAFFKDCHKKGKTNVSDEFTLQTSGNSIRFITISIMPLVQKSKEKTALTGTIIKIDDNTEKRNQEILLHRMESLASLTNLAASVAHEIKNPLGAISIHIQLIQKAVRRARETSGMLPAEKFMENYLDVVNEEIENLNKIVVDFLFAVRPVKANLSLVEPNKVLKHFTDFFIPELKSKGMSIKIDLCKENPRLLIDEKLFRQIIANIEQNAIAAIKSRFQENENKGILNIVTYVKEDIYYISLSDNGCGMNEETMNHIFEPYFTTKADGTGLGMTMVYKIVKEFSGDINVKSEENNGTEFIISLPIPQKDKRLLTDSSRNKVAESLLPFLDADGNVESRNVEK